MSITLSAMTATQREAFRAHCARTGESPAQKIKRLNRILHADNVALHQPSRARHSTVASF